jgi:hypothetical protein
VPEQPAAQPPIVRKDGDESSQAFWNLFVSGSDQRTVAKETAIFVVGTVVSESVGPRYSNQPVTFRTEPITVADVLATIEKLWPGGVAIESAQGRILSAQGWYPLLCQQLAFL